MHQNPAFSHMQQNSTHSGTGSQLTNTLPQSASLKGKYYYSWNCFSAGCL